MWISSAFAMVAAAHLPKRSFSKAFGDMHNTLVSAAFRTLTLQAHAAYIYVHSTEDSLINTTKLSSAHARPSEGSPGGKSTPRQNAIVPRLNVMCSASHCRATSPSSSRFCGRLRSSTFGACFCSRLFLLCFQSGLQAICCRLVHVFRTHVQLVVDLISPTANTESASLGLLKPWLLFGHILQKLPQLGIRGARVLLQLSQPLVGKLHLL